MNGGHASPGLRVAVVDDEAPARELLQEYLAAERDVVVVAQCGNGFEAVRAIAETHPDLLLLDVQMPGLSGFDLIEVLEIDIPVVFVTAHEEHAVRAFEVHAVDYLLKPVTRERLATAVARARQRVGTPQWDLHAAVINAVAADSSPLRRILVRQGAEVRVIAVEKLCLVEARDDYVLLHTDLGTFRKQQTLAQLEQALDPGTFMRAHRSFVVNLDRVERLERYARGSYLAVLTGDRRVPVSRSAIARLRRRLEA